VIVLCVHDIVEDAPTSPWEINSADLESLLARLRRSGHRFGTLDEPADADGATVALTVDDGPSGALRWLGRRAPEFGIRGTLFVVVDWLDAPPPRSPGYDYRGLAGWDDVRDLHAAGHVVGSHSMSHVPLPTLAPLRLRHELHTSRRRLQESLGTEVEHFAAPFGKLSPAVLAEASAAGYRTVSSTVPGINGVRELADGVLRRIVLRSDRPDLDAVAVPDPRW
jgi:peptidoglycan/xylan/chitin deacetylase (PgdA/CDA1 family)